MTTIAQPPVAGHVPATQMQYLEAGHGSPVLFLHGWAAFKEIWWGTLQAIAPRYHGVALEWPGHGRSPATTDATRLSDLAELAARSATALGLHDITVVGHSMGGRVAALLALAHPELVTRLVLVDAALNPEHLAGYTRRLLRLTEIERTIALSTFIGRGFGHWLRPVPHDHRGGLVGPYLRRAYYNGLADAPTLHNYVQALHADSIEERLPELQQPTLVVTGARDPLVLPRQARRAAELLPHGQLVIIPRAMHNPMDDRPADFYRVLLQFLDATA